MIFKEGDIVEIISHSREKKELFFISEITKNKSCYINYLNSEHRYNSFPYFFRALWYASGRHVLTEITR